MKKALIAMSGGVDSSVAAAWMLRCGYECIGVNMKLHDFAPDPEDAAAVCEKLGMEFQVCDFRAAFEQEVIRPFVCTYEGGDTPNPCIECNRHMKFARLHAKAKELGCEVLVTGHYARVAWSEQYGRWVLKKARNLPKDQSYVLYFLTAEQLRHTRFPLGDFEHKEEIRALAQLLGLENAHKSDSQDICFIPDGDYAAFLEGYTGKAYAPGDFVDTGGRVLGQHKGLVRYTIGQRRGLGISAPEPLYVKEKRVEANQVVLAANGALFADHLTAHSFVWSAIDAPAQPIRCAAKTRYQAKETPCTARVNADGTVAVTLDAPVRAITSGQAVVLYDDDTVLGGGIIGRSGSSAAPQAKSRATEAAQL